MAAKQANLARLPLFKSRHTAVASRGLAAALRGRAVTSETSAVTASICPSEGAKASQEDIRQQDAGRINSVSSLAVST